MSEDWDSFDGPAIGEKNYDGQFKSAFTLPSKNTAIKGLGRGRGFALKLDQDSAPPAQFSNCIKSNDDDDWNEGSGPQGDAGNSYFGGFGGSKSSFDDNKENNGFSFGGNQNDDEAPYGGGARGSKGCYKCGETGHMSRECPSSTSSSRDGCFKCGESGHMSRDCPNSANSGGGGSRNCFKCGESGHMSRECPNSASSGGGGSGSRDCFKCGESGHMSRECPSSGGGGSGSRDCFKCGESGHMSRECPNSASSGGGGSGSRDCFKCGESGHMSRECPKAGESGGSTGSKGCFKCGESGHMSKDCTATTTADGKPVVEKYIPPTQPDDESSLFDSSVPTGINFSKYDNIPVQLSDNSKEPIPLSRYDMKLFETSGLYSQLVVNIKKSNYKIPTPVQKHSIPIIREGRDLMACAQTGSGKTAAFLLPIMTSILEESFPLSSKCNPYVLILVPTRELAMQTRREAQKFAHNTGIRAVEVYGGVSSGHQRSQIELGCNILIATVGRLKDFLTRRVVTLEEVKYLVLDEADRMLEQRGFKDDVLDIIQQRGMPPKESRQSLMFSATFPREVQELAKEFLNNYIFLSVGTIGSANQDVTQHFHQCSQFEKRDKLVEILSEAGTDRTMVFVEQKRTADFIASYLCQNSFPTTSIHGDRLQRERELALSDFRRGDSTILIATNVAARGLDINGVKHVINYDLPSEMQDYVHRIGRTGRVGNIGKSTSFYDSAVDSNKASALKKILEDAAQEVPQWLAAECNDSFSGDGFVGRLNTGSSDIRGPRKTFDNGNDYSTSGSTAEPAISNSYSATAGGDEWD